MNNNILENFKNDRIKTHQNKKEINFYPTEENHKLSILQNLFRHDFIQGENIIYYTAHSVKESIYFNYYITNLTNEIERLEERISYYTNRDKFKDNQIAKELNEYIYDLKLKCKI